MSDELKPCPFCGGERASPIPANRASEDRHYPIVRCMGCYMDMPGETGDFSIGCRTAIAAWNTRADTDALTAAQEENERLVHDIERLSASLSAEVTGSERLREHLRRMLLAKDGIPLNAITFGKWVKEARAALNVLPR